MQSSVVVVKVKANVVTAVSYTHLDVYKRQQDKPDVLQFFQGTLHSDGAAGEGGR